MLQASHLKIINDKVYKLSTYFTLAEIMEIMEASIILLNNNTIDYKVEEWN